MQKKKVIRPMLACSRNVTLDDLQSLQYPLYASIKQDGIRCRLDSDRHGLNIQPMSRALKPLPNMYIQEWAKKSQVSGLDGEIVIPGWTFNDIQSWVMTAYPIKKQPFEFRIFDFLDGDPKADFDSRFKTLDSLNGWLPSGSRLIMQHWIQTPTQLQSKYEMAISLGNEGLILRSPHGLYKSGRSTWNQAYSLKMKAFEDAEATIIGFYPLQENQNESVINELGLKKKSSHKSNQILKEMLGGFEVYHPKFGNFRIGSGPTAAQRILWWKYKGQLLGEEITFKFQRHGMKDKPRTPIIKSLNYILPLQ